MCDRPAKFLRMEEVTRLGKMLGIKGHSTACPSGSLSSTVVVCIGMEVGFLEEEVGIWYRCLSSIWLNKVLWGVQ